MSYDSSPLASASSPDRAYLSLLQEEKQRRSRGSSGSSSTLRLQTPRKLAPLLSPARYKGAHGGRGGAKSHFFAESLIERCVSQPTRWICLREVQRSLAGSSKQLLEDKIQKFGLGAAFRVMDSEIRCPWGGLISFQGMQNHTAETVKSLEGYDGAWFEEARNCSQRSLDLLRPTIRKPGSELWFSWNPRFSTDPVDALLRDPEKLPPGAVVVEASYQDNPWFPDVLRAEMEYDRRRDPDKYAHIWLGGYETKSEARVFRNWRIEEFDTPGEAECYYGGDWGFSVDPTVLVRFWINRATRTLWVDHEAYRVGCPIDEIADLFDTVPGARPVRGLPPPPIRVDSARPETIEYVQRHGYPNLVAAQKGPGSVEDGIEFLQSYDIVVHPRCVHCADELTAYSWKTDRLTGKVLMPPQLEDKENHVIDSLRYGAEEERRGRRPLPITRELVARLRAPSARRYA